MAPRIKPAKTFPKASEKIILVASLRGDSAKSRVLVDFDNGLASKLREMTEMVNSFMSVDISDPRGTINRGFKIKVLANLDTSELKGLRGMEPDGTASDYYKPVTERGRGALVYEVKAVYFIGKASLPP